MNQDIVTAHLESVLKSASWRVVERYLNDAVTQMEEKALAEKGTLDDLRHAQGARLLRDKFINALQRDANTQAES